MHAIFNFPRGVLQITAAMFPLVAFACAVRADIFQWEYINPADPSQGKQQSTTLAPDGAGVDAVPGADLSFRDLTKAYLSGAKLHSPPFCNRPFGCYSSLSHTNLTDAYLSSADLSNLSMPFAELRGADLSNADLSRSSLSQAGLSNADLTKAQFEGASLSLADFTDARIKQARFDVILDVFSFFTATANSLPLGGRIGTGITLDQLYTTASYKSHDLTGIGFRNHLFVGGIFANQNLAEARFSGAYLTNASFAQADLSNASFAFADLTDANLTDANVLGTSFQKRYVDPQGGITIGRLGPVGTGITPDQLYSTASYKARDLAGIDLYANELIGVNMFRQRLSNADFGKTDLTYANFEGAHLTGADFTDAKVRGANFAPILYSPPFSESIVIGTGISLEQLYSSASYRARDLSGIRLSGHDLTDANFSSQNLQGSNFGAGANYSEYGTRAATLTGATFTDADLAWARFDHATLTDADFTGAAVRGASFVRNLYVSQSGTGITLTQLYSTASYQARDLSGMDFGGNLFDGGKFAGQKLTNSSFGNLYYAINWRTGQPEWQIFYATLTGADFSGADTRGARSLEERHLSAATTTNLIWPDGHINGLDLTDGRPLVVRDYDFGTPIALPFPVMVNQHFATAPGGTLRMVFEADAWDSTISFAPGIPITLGGTLELTFAGDVNLASQVGRTFDLFDWTGVNPTGTFAISSPYAWDLSNLHTTGEVTLTAVPESSGLALAAVGAFRLTFYRRRKTP